VIIWANMTAINNNQGDIDGSRAGSAAASPRAAAE